MILSSVKKRLCKIIKNIERALFKRSFRKDIAPKNYCYISQNCIGGKFYQIEKRLYSSPTVGLWFESADFLTFCENLPEYLNFTLSEDVDKSKEVSYPVGRLGEIRIYFLHYSSFQLAKLDWDRRVKRVNLGRVFFLMTDRDGFSEDSVRRFNSLPTRKKILLSHCSYLNMKNIIYVPGFEFQSYVGDLVSDLDKLLQTDVRTKLLNLLKA